MEPISKKKIAISYVITSIVVFVISAFTSMAGLFGNDIGSTTMGMSIELMALIQLVIVLSTNLLLHAVFYYGGFNASPIKKELVLVQF